MNARANKGPPQMVRATDPSHRLYRLGED